jgi:murein DD-endopeptidase MepM/ murein hydrolase activator NlpD
VPAPPPPAPPPVVHAPTPAPQPVAARGSWDWEGGTAVTVAPGETIDIIAHRYGVPSGAILQSNGLNQQAPLYPGQRLVIPRYNHATTGSIPARSVAAPAAAPVVAAAASASAPGVHVVGPGDTLTRIAKIYRKSIVELAAANNIAPHAMLKMGDRITIPGGRAATPALAAAPRTLPAPVGAVAAIPPPVAAAPRVTAPQKVVTAEPAPTARIVTPAADNPAKDETATADGGNSPGFRWPVRGRVITGFGPKPTGQQNDGINLAVPEGTAIKAAEDGVVAYAGSELKGYGNLVLVRHSNGYVTAYAHASELMVKRGDQIKRGQVIAKSGQTGSVTSPQLHFEIRKGASPVDPMQFLNGAT